MKLTRIAALVAAAVTLAAVPLAQAQTKTPDKVSLRLNWYLGGLHVPFYYGKDKGYFAEEGIDLTINEGRGSGNTVQVVAAGSDTFGMADSSSVIATAAKGADIKSVMSLLNTSSYAVVSLADKPIKTPQDLPGKKVAVTPGDPLGQLLQAVCKVNNVDCGKITLVQVDPAAKIVAVLEKKTDALLGGVDDQYFLIKYKGGNPVAMPYADFDVNTVGMTIMTTADTISKNPDLVRRFVKASVKSWEEAKKNPGAAVDAAMKAKPDLNRQSTLDQLNVDLGLLESKNSKGRIGWGAQADWEQTLSILRNYRDVATDKPWTFFHTNEFLPK